MIKSSTILFLILLVGFGSCNHQAKHINDPRVSLYSGLDDKDQVLELLEKNESKLNEWKDKAPYSERLNDKKTVAHLLRNVETYENDFLTVHKYLSKGSVWHFGFDRNFHALVVFDIDDNVIKVIKW